MQEKTALESEVAVREFVNYLAQTMGIPLEELEVEVTTVPY